MLRKNLETIFEECNQNGIFVAIDETCETYILDKQSLRKIFTENPQYFGYMYLQIDNKFEFVEEIREEGSAEVYFGFGSLTVKNLNKTTSTIMSIFKKYNYEVVLDKQTNEKFYVVLSDNDIPSSYMKYLCENFANNETDEDETEDKEKSETEEEEEDDKDKSDTEDEDEEDIEKSDTEDEEGEEDIEKSGGEDEEDIEKSETEDTVEVSYGHDEEELSVDTQNEEEEIYGSGDESDKSKKESGVKSDDEDESDCDSDESCPEGCVCWNCKAEREETEDK